MNSENSEQRKPVPLDCALGAEKLTILANAITAAHLGTCRYCPEYHYPEPCSGDGCGSEVSCCQCEACKIARDITSPQRCMYP